LSGKYGFIGTKFVLYATVDFVIEFNLVMGAFSNLSVNYVCRDLNVLAHRLVGYAMREWLWCINFFLMHRV
jgi:hypothetical protein